jgi:hypothetical protein
MATCGLWMTAHRLVAVAIDGDGAVGPGHQARRNDAERWDLVSRIEAEHGLDCVFVVTETLLAADVLPRIAMRRGAHVRVAPDELVGCATRLAPLRRASPRAMAALLARMPLSPPFADRLLRLELQLPLL